MPHSTSTRLVIPNQHGAWAMLITPAVLGCIKAWGHISVAVLVPVVVAWFSGYCAFFAFGMWVKARRNAHRRAYYTRSLLVYGGISVGMCAVALSVDPSLIRWALYFAPLVGVAVCETYNKRPRSVLSGAATTVASALLYAVLIGRLNIATGFLMLYFTGTIMVVKSLIRERSNTRFWYASLWYHVLAIVAMGVVIYANTTGHLGGETLGGVFIWLSFVTLLVALVRAWALPFVQRRGLRVWKAKDIGVLEMMVLVLACAAILG
ncbi:YwiC-like family protein [Corynebacterium rouxii]|uniref:YwiC-like family protein n=1 Tax=Corynebacterium rouxii TaxID=2719119 RepID=UPI003CEB974C